MSDGNLSPPWYVAWPLIAAFCYGILWVLANRSVYYPMKYPQGLWDLQSQLPAEDVWLQTSDGVRLHAWWVRKKDAPLVTLYVHGNAGNVTHRYPQIREILNAGSSVLMFDYRGYGRSEGWPTEKGLYGDAHAAYEHLRSAGYQPEQIVLHGESIGTSVAIELASRKPCGGIVLEAPFTSARDVARRVFPVLGPLLIWSYNSSKKIGRVRVPLLFIQGDEDEIIPLELSRGLYDAASQPKSFWIVKGAKHNDILEVAGREYGERLRSFYQSLPAAGHQ